jgi:hypothetical protein
LGQIKEIAQTLSNLNGAASRTLQLLRHPPERARANRGSNEQFIFLHTPSKKHPITRLENHPKQIDR